MPTCVQFRRGATAIVEAFVGADGEIAIDSTKHTIRVYDGSTAGGFEIAKADLSNTTAITSTSTTTLTNKSLSDSTTYFIDETDTTKKFQFQASGITTGTTRTLTIPDATGTVALTSNKLSTFAATTSAELAGVISDETGSGALVFATSPTLVTPNLGTPTSLTLTNATGLPVSGITASTTTALGVGSIELGHATDTTIARSSAGVVTIEGVTISTESNTLTFTNKSLSDSTTYFIDETDATKKFQFQASGITTATTRTLTIPDASGTIALTSNKLSTFAATTSAELADVISDETGSGALVFGTSPSLTTPILGVASATSINKVAITTPATSATLTIADGKTLTANNTLTFTGTDSSSVAFGTGGTVAYTANKLSTFAATTSAELAGVISDETGSGALVFATSPTFTTSIGITSSGQTTQVQHDGINGVLSSSTQLLLYSNGANATIFHTNSTERWRINSSGHLLAGADNTYDIGASGATRPRNIYIAGTGAIGDNTTIGGTTVRGKLTVDGGQSGTATSSAAFRTPGSAQSEKANLALYSTFEGTADNGVRRSADIISGFNGGAWGYEFLAVHVGSGGSANDTAAVTTERLRIDGSGNVGIATTSPSSKLHVKGDVTVGGDTSASSLKFLEPSGSGSNYTAFKAQAQSADVTYTLPAADGSSGQVLSTNGSGTLSWQTSTPTLSSRTITTTGSILSTDTMVEMNGQMTLTLPSVSTMTGKTIFFRNINNTEVTIIGYTTSDLINGQLNLVVRLKNSTFGLYSNGSNWAII